MHNGANLGSAGLVVLINQSQMTSLRHPRRHDDLLNFRLKRLFSIGGAPAVRLCEGRYGIARNEWRVLAALAEHGKASPSALYARIGGDPGRASRVVASLAAKGLVVRTADGADRRRAMLAISPSGRALYRAILPKLRKINERLMSVLTEEEARLLEDYLCRLTEHAQRILGDGGGVAERADRRKGGSRRVWARATAGDARRVHGG